jgi:hypothetical protein
MAFADFVARVFGKTAVWVYRIEVPGDTYHLTGWPFDVSVGGWQSGADRPSDAYPTGQLFDFTGISRGEITETTASSRSEVWVSLPTSHPAMIAAREWDEPEEIRVTIWVTYLDDPDEEYVTRFIGRVTSIEVGQVLSRLICEDALTEMDRASAAQVASVLCRHTHYFTEADGSGCTLDIEDWLQAALVTAATGKILTVPAAALQPDGTFFLGILRYDGTEFLIARHEGETLQLDRIPPGLAAALSVGDVDVDIAPGCDLRAETCRDRFDNILNHGGLTFMERGETPFDGRSIA